MFVPKVAGVVADIGPNAVIDRDGFMGVVPIAVRIPFRLTTETIRQILVGGSTALWEAHWCAFARLNLNGDQTDRAMGFCVLGMVFMLGHIGNSQRRWVD